MSSEMLESESIVITMAPDAASPGLKRRRLAEIRAAR